MAILKAYVQVRTSLSVLERKQLTVIFSIWYLSKLVYPCNSSVHVNIGIVKYPLFDACISVYIFNSDLINLM